MDQVATGRERVTAATFLFLVVLLQFLTAISTAIRVSSGHMGRLVYYFAFIFNFFHDIFMALVIPSTLVLTAIQLLRPYRSTDALLAAIVATLWYGPDRVQDALSNLVRLRMRCCILFAALGEYHRAALETDVAGNSLLAPLPVRRRLSFWPWWSGNERAATKYWNGRVIDDGTKSGVLRLVDGQLRAVARHGVHMALTGDFDESKLRAWCAAMVADQARFAQSLLDESPEFENMGVFSGCEGRMIRQNFDDFGKSWSNDELRRLAYVANGIRNSGLAFIRSKGWVE